MSRIQITREDFISSFIKVDKSPSILTTKLEKPPFCHLLSTYVIKPVACDEQPFLIQHKNRQPVIVSQKKNVIRRPKANEVTNLSDSDEDFEKVVTDKKRAKGHAAGATAVSVAQAEVNPQFPASDPSRVIVIEKKDKKREEAPPKAAIVRNSEAKPKKSEEPIAADQKGADDFIKRIVPAQKAQVKKSVAKPAAAAKAAVDPQHAAMMKAMFAGASTEAPAATVAPVQPQPAKEPEKQKRPTTSKKGKKNSEEQKEEKKAEAPAKPQSAAPKKERPAKEEPKKQPVSLESLLSEEEKQYKHQQIKVKKIKEEAKRIDQNDFASAFGAAANLSQEQDRLKKVGRAARAAKSSR